MLKIAEEIEMGACALKNSQSKINLCVPGIKAIEQMEENREFTFRDLGAEESPLNGKPDANKHMS